MVNSSRLVSVALTQIVRCLALLGHDASGATNGRHVDLKLKLVDGPPALSDRIRGLLLSDTDFETSEVRRKGLLPKASVEHGQATLVASGSTNGSNKMVVKPFPFTLPVSKVTPGTILKRKSQLQSFHEH